MERIYKSILILINYFSKLGGVCYRFKMAPNKLNGEDIIDTIEKCEEYLSIVKKDILEMVKDCEEEIEEEYVEEDKITGTGTNNGILLDID